MKKKKQSIKMAEIKPIRAWRYNDSLTETIDTLTSPLFDVVSEKQRKSLYQNPLNSIHLSVPQGPHAADHAQRLLKKWKADGTVIQDKLPAIYVYYQYFKLAGSSKEFCRKGFICHIRTYRMGGKGNHGHECNTQCGKRSYRIAG